MRLKVYCCIFLTTCAGSLLASEVARQDEAAIPALVTIQTELGLIKSFTKEAISLQKQTLLMQGATLAKTADILAQEKLQIAAFDKDACISCGICFDRCHFQALNLVENEIDYNPELCRGCGFCTGTCPTGALKMKNRI